MREDCSTQGPIDAPDPLTAVPFRRRLWLLSWNFFKIALFVVGGGYAIILAAEEIFVKRLRWLRDGELMEMLTVIQAVPGLMAGNAAIYVGFRSAGQWGALAALVAVALPSYLIICLVSAGFGWIPMENLFVQGAFIGVRTALSGLTLVALLRLWPKAIRSGAALLGAIFTFATVYFCRWNPAILLGAGAAAGFVLGWYRGRSGGGTPPAAADASAGCHATSPPPPHAGEGGEASLLVMFLLFLWFGLLCIGGGSVLMPLYIQELVEARCWLTLHELSDFAAISQVTPGPIGVNLATFLGYRQGGMWGALVCTVGLLAPSYFLMQGALHSLSRWHENPLLQGIMSGLAPVTLGLMAATGLIYLELSLFTAPIPWGWGGSGSEAASEAFGICLGAAPILAGAVWALRRERFSIMTVIFASAALGALICRK